MIKNCKNREKSTDFKDGSIYIEITLRTNIKKVGFYLVFYNKKNKAVCMKKIGDYTVSDIAINEIEIPSDFLIEGAEKVKDNKTISAFYEILASDKPDISHFSGNEIYSDKLLKKSNSVKNCHNYWNLETYEKLKFSDILSISLCKDKFCKNCQNELSKTRYRKYVPVLDDFKKKYDLYHVVFTVKNVSGDKLKKRLNDMYEKFPLLIQKLKGNKDRKVKGIDFSWLGYAGAVRSLEINVSIKNKQYDYHPHFHCIFLFRKGLDMDKLYINDFSYSRKRGNTVRKFTAFEILLQKMWYLTLNGKKINLKNLNSLDEGYSVMVEKIEDTKASGYKEVFKYTLKEDFKAVYDDYYVFRTLYDALYRRKIIQGYGVLNKYIFDDEILEKNMEIEANYLYFKSELEKLDIPVRENVCWEQMLRSMKSQGMKFFSKNNIRKFLLQLKDDFGDIKIE